MTQQNRGIEWDEMAAEWLAIYRSVIQGHGIPSKGDSARAMSIWVSDIMRTTDDLYSGFLVKRENFFLAAHPAEPVPVQTVMPDMPVDSRVLRTEDGRDWVCQPPPCKHPFSCAVCRKWNQAGTLGWWNKSQDCRYCLGCYTPGPGDLER